jgi:beta-glucosidase
MTRTQLGHTVLALSLAVGASAAPPAEAQTAAPARTIDSLLARMTLEEKLGQLNLLSVNDRPSPAQLDLLRGGLVGGFLNLTGAAATRAAQQVAVTEPRLHIPLLLGFDVIHGYRTTFPIPLAEASTWDPAAVEAAAHVAAREAAAAGVNWTFAPMVDIARDPRWGRIAESAGEDPYLGSVMAAARVRGFQGADLRASDAVLATAKHFAAYGGAEAGRDYSTVDVSERTLREIYLPPFRAALDAGVGSIMTSFNEIAGVPSTANRWLVTTLLRGEWKFRGMVVRDWTSIDELRAHGVAGSRAEAGKRALDAGVDMDMVSQIYVDDLPALVRAGRIPVATVNAAVRHVLQAKLALGLFDDPYHGATVERERVTLVAPEHRELARRVAREAIVLLKHDPTLLPLGATGRTLAVIGPLADDPVAVLGPWSGHGDPHDAVTPLQGIRARAGEGTKVLYARGSGTSDSATAGIADAVALARQAEVAVVVLGETADMSGEAASRSTLGLPGVQQQLLEALAGTGTPIVLVLMSGRPLAVAWAAEHVPAIVQTWFLGDETGHALADVLFGDVNPSGKLPVTVPRALGQVPIYYNHKNTGRPPAAEKYTSKYLDLPVSPLYPFGYGLSYTTFSYSDLRLSAPRIGPAGSLTVSAVVTNTGPREGTEVAQLYVRDEVASVTRPVRALAGFRRVALRPGEAQKVEFVLTARQLGFYNEAMRFTVEPGRFRVFVGPSSAEGIEGTFEVQRNR